MNTEQAMNIKDYIHYYIGQSFQFDNKQWEMIAVSRKLVTGWRDNTEISSTEIQVYHNEAKLMLRRLSDMTEEGMIGLLQSMVPADLEDKPTEDDYSLDMFYNDDGLMVDSDITIGANYSCRCYSGQIAIRECGSVITWDDKDMERPINIPKAFHYLLKEGFDVFGLIDAGLAIDAKSIQPPNKQP